MVRTGDGELVFWALCLVSRDDWKFVFPGLWMPWSQYPVLSIQCPVSSVQLLYSDTSQTGLAPPESPLFRAVRASLPPFEMRYEYLGKYLIRFEYITPPRNRVEGVAWKHSRVSVVRLSTSIKGGPARSLVGLRLAVSKCCIKHHRPSEYMD